MVRVSRGVIREYMHHTVQEEVLESLRPTNKLLMEIYVMIRQLSEQGDKS